MNQEPRKQIIVENARIIFPNFSGRESQYNDQGKKSFCVILDPDLAERMVDEGWNVRYTNPREEGDEPEPYVQVECRFDKFPPKVVLLTDRHSPRTMLDENTIEVLDYANIKQADLIANGSDWFVNGKSGVKAYLRSLFVTIEEDYLEKKYAVQEPE